MTNQRLMLLILGLCIVMVVVLNMSYLPKIVSATMNSNSMENLAHEFSNTNELQKKGGVSLAKVKDWSQKRGEAKNNNQQDQPKQKPPPSSPSAAAAVSATKDKKSPLDKTEASYSSKIAGLNCDQFGGPPEDIAAEMVYWRDIPSDAQYHSPFAKYGPSPKYLIFEPDEGGWYVECIAATNLV
jgi:hypothetical protein